MTKRIRAALLALCMAFSLAHLPAFAQVRSGKCGATVYYSYDPATYELTITGTGNMRSYTLSSPTPWDSYCEEIESVSIASGVTSIGSYAFYYCKGLESVTISDSVTDIENDAFLECVSLTNITIPDSVTNIGDSAFQHCKGLKKITIPGSVKRIGDSAFASCYISAGESEIGIEIGLEKVVVQDGVEAIGAFAFYRCKKLNDVTLPDSVTSIGDNAFQYSGLYNDDSEWEALYIGKHLIKADNWALNKNGTSDFAVDPETKTIADNAFSGCECLKSITIPDSVLSIGNQAFSSCTGLTSITIPKGVTSIGDYVFQNCCDLAEIKVAAENNAYCSENGVLYDKEKTEIICFPKEKQDTVFDIPGSVISIATGAFSDCLNLTGITIPNGVSSIGDYAFYECSGLTSIIIPDGVPSLGLKAFYGCSSLESVTIPNSVISIGEQAFLECGNFETINYIGTDSEWKKILRGDKCSIDGKTMKYCKGINAKHTDVGIVVRPINIDSGKTVILALYNGDKLVGIQSKIYGGTEVTFETNEAYSELKAMVWEDLAGMLPVCGAKTIK